MEIWFRLSTERMTRDAIRLFTVAGSVALLFAVASAQSTKPAPRNMGAGLRQLVQMHNESVAKGQSALDLRGFNAKHATQKAGTTGLFRINVDSQNRVLVNLYLDGSVSADSMREHLKSLGASVLAADTSYRGGVIAAHIPIASAEQVATARGVRSVMLVHRPFADAGKTTSQGARVLRSNVVNGTGGITGKGITVGLISDSFNTSGNPIDAAADVKSGDLPKTTAIPGGEGLKFLIERDPTVFGPGTDEGRGMSQIVHDVAPGADLCFATAEGGQVVFANNIRSLRTEPACNADVIVDDVIYPEEPMFSDGVVAQAVDEVVTSNSLPGKKVSYFSSAGNRGEAGYASDLRIIPDSVARGMSPGTLGIDLSTIPADIDTTGGFHNFATGSKTSIFQDLLFLDGTIIAFQWDDPFDLNPSGITTDLNILLFDPATGQFVGSIGEDNFATNEPLEEFELTADGGVGEYLIVIARTGAGAHLSKRVKYEEFNGAILDLTGFITSKTPMTYGHNCAKNGNGVAAYVYDLDPAFSTFTPQYEPFSSPGPSTIAFDKDGNRLAQAQIRRKPDIAAPDGVNTTFFPPGADQDYESFFGVPDGFPNFFGTSAAAPHAAAVAALVIQAAGGPSSIPPKSVADVLKTSSPPRDVDVFFSKAEGSTGNNQVQITAQGENLTAVGDSPRFFTLTFQATKPGQTLNSLTLNLAGTSLVFDINEFPATLGSTTGPTLVSATPTTGPSRTVTLNFSGFTSGNKVRFGVDRDYTNAAFDNLGGGNDADPLGGAKFKAVLSDSTVVTGTFVNDLQTGWRLYDGFGLIDAVNAVNQVR